MIRVRFRHEKSIFSLTFFKLPLSVDTEKISVKTGPENLHSPQSRPERALRANSSSVKYLLPSYVFPQVLSADVPIDYIFAALRALNRGGKE